jgi:glutaredoxin
MQNKGFILPAIIGLVFFAAIFFAFSKNNPPANGQIILFYGDGCPHCINVDKFINDNKVEEKISFVRKEVFNNQKNAEEMAGKAKTCGLPTDTIGVPFLWTGSQCVLGDTDIINFFKEKIGS